MRKLWGKRMLATVLAGAMLVGTIGVTGCKKDEGNNATSATNGQNPVAENSTTEAPSLEETATFIPDYERCVGYEDVDYIQNEDYMEYLNLDLIDKSLTGFNGAFLIAIDDTIVYAKGYGYTDETSQVENTIHTTFGIGEMSTGFVAEAIFKLSEQGLLSLDDTIDKWFPSFVQGKTITVRDLVEFASGIPNYFKEPEKFYNGEELKTLIDGAVATGENVPKNFLIDYLTDIELNFETGTNRIINYTDYYLLGIIIEEVSGMPYENYIYEQVLLDNDMYMTNLAYDGAMAKPISKKDVYIKHSNLARGCMTGNTNVIEMYKWIRHVSKDVYRDYETAMKMGLTGYDIDRGYADGYAILNTLTIIPDVTEPSQVDLTKNMLYVVFVTNSMDDLETLNRYYYNVANHVNTLLDNYKVTISTEEY